MYPDKMKFKITLNGRERDVYSTPDRTLLEVIREDFNLTGTKQGCDDTNCGVCTVLMNGKAVKSCTVLIPQACGKEIITIEGVGSDDTLAPMQQSFIDNFAVQCGFCTPGMILTAIAILNENPKATEEDIREGLHGNLCRCTGYSAIVKAVEAVRDGEYKELEG